MERSLGAHWQAIAGRSHSYATAFLFVTIAVLCVTGFGWQHPIQDDNEGLYARVAVEMLERGSWTIPTLDGVPYIEKPPLLYWVTATSFALFGIGDGAARAAPALGLALTLSALFVFARRWWTSRTAWAAVAIALSSPLLVVMSRMLMFDLLFTGFYTWAVMALYESMRQGNGVRWLRVAYAATAFAVLTKGLVALVFVTIMATGLVLQAPATWRARAALLANPSAIALFLAIVVPWHVAAALREPGFAWFYFVNEHVLRFLDLRQPRDYYHGPCWYYLPRLALAMGPWIMALGLPARAPTSGHRERAYLWLSFLAPLAFFSASGAKANYYMVVAIPSLVLLVAERVERMRPTAAVWLAGAWAAIGLAAYFYAPRLAGGYRMPATLPAFCGTLVLIATAGALLLARRRTIQASIAFAALSLPLSLFTSAYLEANSDLDSTKEIAGAIAARGPAEVFAYRDYEKISSLAYYLKRPIGVIDSASNDLRYGIGAHPDRRRFPTVEDFLHSGGGGPILIVATEARRAALEGSVLGAHIAHVRTIGKTHIYAWGR